jgi:hypothetical protein
VRPTRPPASHQRLPVWVPMGRLRAQWRCARTPYLQPKKSVPVPLFSIAGVLVASRTQEEPFFAAAARVRSGGRRPADPAAGSPLSVSASSTHSLLYTHHHTQSSLQSVYGPTPPLRSRLKRYTPKKTNPRGKSRPYDQAVNEAHPTLLWCVASSVLHFLQVKKQQVLCSRLSRVTPHNTAL